MIVFVATCYMRDVESWVAQSVFLSECEATKYAYKKTQDSVRCNRPLEFWRVEKHMSGPCSGHHVVWGPNSVMTGPCQ